MKTTNVFTKNLNAAVSKKRFIINQGGTSSSKTYSILQNLILICHRKNNLVISIVAETYPHLRRGAARDFYKILQTEGIYSETNHNKTDGSYRIGTNVIEFFSGDNIEKMKGSRRDILFVNEAYGLKYDIFDQLEVRTNWLVFIDYNPVSEFWVHEKILTGFSTDCEFIHSTYRDNPFLSKRIIQSIERHRENKYWWRVYGEGLIGIVEGLVYPEFEQVEQFPKGLDEVYGLDFGYTNSPTTLVKVGIDHANMAIYIDEYFYRTGMTKDHILSEMRRMHVQPDIDIIADSEDPRLIAELDDHEFTVHGAVKQKVKDEIDVIKRYRIFVTQRSTHTIRELRNYMYKQDNKTGSWTNEPVKEWDHAMDAFRYGAMAKIRPSDGGSILGMATITGKNYE